MSRRPAERRAAEDRARSRHAERFAAVCACIVDLLDAHRAAPVQRDVVTRALLVAHGQARRAASLPCVEVPLLVYEALTGAWRPALPVAAAATLVYLGADALDNVADGEMPKTWRGYTDAQLTLGAATMLATLPYLALDLLQREHRYPAEAVRLLAQRLAAGLLRMSMGQHGDLSRGRLLDVAACEATVAAKSGAQAAMYAGLAAALATRDDSAIEAFAETGQALGTAAQLRSDCHDLFHRRSSADLRTGTRTLPVVFALNASTGAAHAALRALLTRARSDAACHAEVRRRLLAAGALQYVALRIEMQVQRGLAALRRGGGRGRALAALQSRLAGLSLLRAQDGRAGRPHRDARDNGADPSRRPRVKRGAHGSPKYVIGSKRPPAGGFAGSPRAHTTTGRDGS